MSTPSKFGHWIRLLPNPTCFQTIFAAETEGAPTPCKLLQYLFERCSPDVQVGFFGTSIYTEYFGLPTKTIAHFTFPRLQHLSVYAIYVLSNAGLSKLLGLLDQCSTNLKTLRLGIWVPDGPEHFEQTENESKSWTSLKELTLLSFNNNAYTEALFSWLLRRCGSVQRLWIKASDYRAGQSLAQGMLTYLPDLSEIIFGRNDAEDYIPEGLIATRLDGSRNGWGVVDVYPTAGFGKAAMNALLNHFATLEVLNICRYDLFCDGPVRLLRSCTKLHTLAHHWTGGPSDNPNLYFKINAKTFIDLDPVKGSLRPWECEGSLKTLKVIVGIPRPDLKSECVIEEAYPGEGRETRGRVYDRLARLTNLETLWLGSSSNTRQTECMELSLGSGLYKLSGLKRLGELNVTCLRTRIGVKEVQWMVETGPGFVPPVYRTNMELTTKR